MIFLEVATPKHLRASFAMYKHNECSCPTAPTSSRRLPCCVRAFQQLKWTLSTSRHLLGACWHPPALLGSATSCSLFPREHALCSWNAGCCYQCYTDQHHLVTPPLHVFSSSFMAETFQKDFVRAGKPSSCSSLSLSLSQPRSALPSWHLLLQEPPQLAGPVCTQPHLHCSVPNHTE